MLFAIITSDNPNSLELRANTRPQHLAYLEAHGGSMVFAGPFLDNEGNPDGSLVVVEADTMAEAQKFADNDPYTLAGLFGSVQIRSWKWAINNKEGR